MRKIINRKYVIKWSLIVFLLGFIGIAGGSEKKASASSVASLQTGTEYQEYDITGDGKADSLLLQDAEKDGDVYQAFKAYINGKCALTIKKRQYLYYYDSTVKLINLDNGRAYLYVYLSADNGDGPIDIYAYRDGKLKKEVNLLKSIKYMGYHSGADIHAVKGNKIVIWMQSMSYGLASVTFEFSYQYQNGKLIPLSQTHKIIGYYNMKSQKTSIFKLTCSRRLQLYKTKKLRKKSRVLAKGTKLYVTKCYISGKKISYYVKTSDGKTGWFRSKYSVKEPFDEIGYAG